MNPVYSYYVVCVGPFGPFAKGFELFGDAVSCAFGLLAQGVHAQVWPV